MPAGFRRHLVGKTVINVFHCDITEIRFVGKLMTIRHFHKPTLIGCHLINTINLHRPLTPHILCHVIPTTGDRIVATASVTLLHHMYSTSLVSNQMIFCYYCATAVPCFDADGCVGYWNRQQDRHPACKNWVVGCWPGYLSGAKCSLAYGPTDATATHCLLFQ